MPLPGMPVGSTTSNALRRSVATISRRSPEVVDVADLAAPPEGNAGKVRLQERRRLRIDLVGLARDRVRCRSSRHGRGRRRAGSLQEARSARQERKAHAGGPSTRAPPAIACASTTLSGIGATAPRAPAASPAGLRLRRGSAVGRRGFGAAARRRRRRRPASAVASAGAARDGFATARSAMAHAGLRVERDVAVGAQPHRGAAAADAARDAGGRARWPSSSGAVRPGDLGAARSPRRDSASSSKRLPSGTSRRTLAVASPTRVIGAASAARGDEPRAAALDLDVDRAREAVERRRRRPTRARGRRSRGRSPRRPPCSALDLDRAADAVERRRRRASSRRDEAAGHVLGRRRSPCSALARASPPTRASVHAAEGRLDLGAPGHVATRAPRRARRARRGRRPRPRPSKLAVLRAPPRARRCCARPSVAVLARRASTRPRRPRPRRRRGAR